MSKKKWSNRKKVIMSVLGVIVVVGLFFGVRMVMGFVKYQQIISGIEIRTPNLTQIQDGTYNGFLDAVEISADVDVTVKDHRITNVVINRHHYGYDRATAAEAVIHEVVSRQSLEGIDAVSGATNSTKVILKSIQNALESGIK